MESKKKKKRKKKILLETSLFSSLDGQLHSLDGLVPVSLPFLPLGVLGVLLDADAVADVVDPALAGAGLDAVADCLGALVAEEPGSRGEVGLVPLQDLEETLHLVLGEAGAAGGVLDDVVDLLGDGGQRLGEFIVELLWHGQHLSRKDMVEK